MASISVTQLSIQFPVYGADSRSLKKHLARVAIGGRLGSQLGSTSRTPIVAALNKVSFTVKAGDRLALVGSNGSGKTTLLRALAGVYAPDQGQVVVDGRVASLLDLSMGIDPTATGIENIRLRGLVAGLSPADIKAKSQAIADFSGLGAFLGLPLKTYSAGMQARLAFAIATSVEAEILLMDEWVAVGDAEFRSMAQARLMGMVENAHIMVLASHDTSLVKSLCNKFALMRHGQISEVYPIEALEEQLAIYNQQVADGR